MRGDSTVLKLADSDKVIAATREWNSRNRVYILSDKAGKWLIMCQRLPALAKYWNSAIAKEDEEMLKPSSLYDCTRGRVSYKLHKYNWRVAAIPLGTEALNKFESMRRERRYQNVCLVGSPNCYTLSHP